MTKAEAKGVKIIFPVDFITADKFDKDANVSKHTLSLMSSLNDTCTCIHVHVHIITCICTCTCKRCRGY